jgi:hypothetical protein
MHAPQAPFDVAVVGFDAIVRVASRSMPTTATEFTFVLQFSNGRWITS